MPGIVIRVSEVLLRRLESEFPAEITLHLVMDNYGTHKHPRVQVGLTGILVL